MKNTEKISRGSACVMICVLMICAAMIISLARESVNNDSIEITTVAMSQETAGTSNIKEEESTKGAPTGMVSLQNVGMATNIESVSEPIVITCTWNRAIEFTQSELELLYTTVYCESGDQELEAQIMVAQTILNRILSDKYPNTLRGVVYQRNAEGKPQFAVINWSDFEDRGWTEDTKAAVHYALAHRAYPLDMLYFRDSYYHNFGQPYKNVGDMYFSTVEVQ